MFKSYVYGKNGQGDIIYIFNITGDKVAEFAYDAWGKPVSSQYYNSNNNPGVIFSPFRYRGYWYDEETGLYYLNSRYYNPAWGRFLNADIYLNANGDIIGYNLFAYCGNNPENNSDPSGKRKYYDPDEPDWSSSFSLSQLEMISEIGIEEFDSYPDEMQDLHLFMAMTGSLPPGIKLRDLYLFYCDYSSNNHSLVYCSPTLRLPS